MKNNLKNKIEIHERLTALEIAFKELSKRFDKHITAFYGKIDKLIWWIIGVLGAVIIGFLINYYK
ncbi:MAG: hypothetical protein AB1414_01230 [bacterium]